MMMEVMGQCWCGWRGTAVERECNCVSPGSDTMAERGRRYDKLTNTGGSNGATMRFAPEGDHGANAGLKAARDFLEPVKRESSFGITNNNHSPTL